MRRLILFLSYISLISSPAFSQSISGWDFITKYLSNAISFSYDYDYHDQVASQKPYYNITIDHTIYFNTSFHMLFSDNGWSFWGEINPGNAEQYPNPDVRGYIGMNYKFKGDIKSYGYIDDIIVFEGADCIINGDWIYAKSKNGSPISQQSFNLNSDGVKFGFKFKLKEKSGNSLLFDVPEAAIAPLNNSQTPLPNAPFPNFGLPDYLSVYPKFYADLGGLYNHNGFLVFGDNAKVKLVFEDINSVVKTPDEFGDWRWNNERNKIFLESNKGKILTNNSIKMVFENDSISNKLIFYLESEDGFDYTCESSTPDGRKIFALDFRFSPKQDPITLKFISESTEGSVNKIIYASYNRFTETLNTDCSDLIDQLRKYQYCMISPYVFHLEGLNNLLEYFN